MRPTAGALAVADQTLAAIAGLDHLWPHNAALVEDHGISLAIQRAQQEPWQTLQPGVGYLLWPATGRVVALSPGDDVSLLTRATAPEAVATCDRCAEPGPAAAIAVVPLPPHLVALAMCGRCVSEFDHGWDTVWIDRGDTDA